MDNEASPAVGGAASDSRKRKAPSSRPSSAKKTTVSKRKTGKVVYSNDGDSLQEAGSSTELLQADRDDSLDVDDEEDDEDDAADSKAGGASSSKAKPSNRKAQNRNAQRESRQRKAAYVKALEGYVALHKVDQSSQLQGLLFAIGLLIDENMKLRSTLGALSSLFADPTQGSRLPDIGVDIHGLKAAVERNDKSYLLDLGELLRERVGMHKQGHQAEKGMQKQEQGSSVDSPSNQPEVSRLREPNSKRAPYNAFEAEPVVFGELTEQGEKMAQQRQDKSSGSTSRQLEAPNLWEPSSKKDALEMEAPIFGSLTAKAEKELLEKIRISGETFESGGLGMLNGPRSPLKGNDNKADEISSMQQEPMSSMEELYRVFQQTTKMEEVAPAQTSANTYSHQATGQGSSTGTPVDYNEYLKSSVLNGGNDDIMNMDFNQFLFPSGPSPPGFQMPDFTNLGLPSIPAYGSHNAPYTSANAYAAATPSTLLQPPHSYSASSTPAFGLPSSASPSAFPSKISETDNAVNTTAQPTSVVSAISASLGGATSKSYADLREASKTLHKQAKQLIKFHLRSKQEDATHELPVALSSTAAQNMMPHDARLDGIIWPAMRDRLIFSSGKIDLEGVLQALESGEAVIVHPTGDLMDPTAWEVSDAFVHAYPGLLDGEILKSCNKWRVARGETQITL